MSAMLAPSILSADFGNLESAVKMVNGSEAEWLHVDVMDGVFVPNISFGFPVMKTLKQHSTKPLDVHLMITEPERYVSRFCEAGAHCVTVHYEASNHLHRTLQQIHEQGAIAGVALNPHTPVHLLESIIHEVDLVCLMSVNPGFAAQSFIDHTYHKLGNLVTLIQSHQQDTLIEVDGGVNLENAGSLTRSGADVLVAGNAVFGAADPLDTIRRFQTSETPTV
jgi:ribulose-phosphate 3-epimerase